MFPYWKGKKSRNSRINRFYIEMEIVNLYRYNKGENPFRDHANLIAFVIPRFPSLFKLGYVQSRYISPTTLINH